MELRGTDNADSLVGGADNDTIYGFGGNDTLKGGAGDDVLAGNDGNDILQGGDGDDYLLGGAGNDTLDGGLGNDWAAYEDATAGVTIDLNKTTAQATGGSGSDKLTSIENVYGSAFNDTLTGNAEANMLVGGAGNDVVSGGKGDDTLWGSEGNDTLDGGDGDDYIVGGAGADIIKGGAGWDWSSYEDAAAGVTVDLNKTTAQDTGGAGIDTITGVEHLYGSAFNDTLTGDAQDNYLWGGDGDDELYGGAGDDHLSGGAGVNVIDGGDGWDTVDYAFSNVGVTINLSGAPAPQIPIPDAVDTIISVEAAMGSAHNDYIVGNDAENYLFGDAGNDVIFGIGGHDTLDGGEGNDILRGSYRKPGDLMLGGAGDDQIIVWTGQGSEGDATIVDGGSGVDVLMFSSVYDITLDLAKTGDQLIAPGVHMIVSNIENVRGSYGNDRLTGDAGNNVINGEQGDDVLDGGAGFDIASYEGDKSVRVDLSKAGPQDTRGAGIDTLSNFEGLKGSLRADILIGDAKDNTLEGAGGDDIIDGGAGADTAIFWGNSTDYAWTLNANGTWTVKGLDGVDTLLNVETLRFNDKTVNLSPSATTVTVDDLVKPNVIYTSSQFQQTVLSPDGRTAYVSDAKGYVNVIDVGAGKVTSQLKLADTIGGMDISADGRFLAVTDDRLEEWTGSGGSATVRVVDLQTGAVKDYGMAVTNTRFSQLVFDENGKIILHQSYTVSPAPGSTLPLVTLDPVSGVFKASAKSYVGGTFAATGDHKVILFTPVATTSASLYLLGADGVEKAEHASPGSGGYYGSLSIISDDGAFVAQRLGSGQISIFDRGLNFAINLTELHPEITAAGNMGFSHDGKHLFVVDAAADKIFQYSTADWSLEKVSLLGVDYLGSFFIYRGALQVSDDGASMVLSSPDQVVTLNTAALVTEGGTDRADTLVGGDGRDTLIGYGGDDILVGGKGGDTLIGGKGADTFVFAAGDTTWTSNDVSGVDVIHDWDAVDKLSFGAHSEFIHYGEATAGSWLQAVVTAPQIMGSQHLSYLSMQVGDDVYVFAAPSGSTNGSSETVVRLANTTLDKISIDNFLPVGDDNANLLIGGALNDTINGGGGNDIIRGGGGNDILSGGAGADVFQFWAGQGGYDKHLSNVDTILDFGSGDKLAFEGAPSVVKESDILRFAVSVDSNGKISAAGALTIEACNSQIMVGLLTQKYLVVSAGVDTYVIADTDPANPGLDQVVLLKGVSSSLVTPDIFAGG